MINWFVIITITIFAEIYYSILQNIPEKMVSFGVILTIQIVFPSTPSVIEISRNLKRNDTNSVEIVASDSLSPSWWCFTRFSTTNAGLKSRLRHRKCQKHSRKCVNFLQYDILNKILHANNGYKFTKKIEKSRKIRNRVFFRHSDNLPMEFPLPPPPSTLIYMRHRLQVASKSAEFQEASRITIICIRLWPVGRLITEFSPE